VPVQLVYPQARLIAAKLRAFVDHAVPRLKARLATGTPNETSTGLHMLSLRQSVP
jgi:hypothetical protein